jgi:hypothetical protein
LVGEVSETEGCIDKLGEVFDAIRRQFLEGFARDEIIARRSFGTKVVDDCLDFGLFKRAGRVF